MMKRAVYTMIMVIFVATVLPASAAHAQADRDPLASVEDMERPQLQVSPPDLFSAEQQGAIEAIVDEARLFGVPLTVRAIGMPTSPGLLPENQLIEGAAPTEQEIVQRIGEEWLATEHARLIEEDIQPDISADESILLMVVVPEDDPTHTVAAFATGDNALPLNGLTQDKLDRILQDVIYPSFETDAIPDGIRDGISHLSYENLFGTPARIERTDNQERLATLSNTVLAAGTALSVVALGAFLTWTDRRRRHSDGVGSVQLTAFAAGALRRGKVDDHVLTGALLHLIQIGALQPLPDRTYVLDKDVLVDDPFANVVKNRLAAEANADGTLPGYILRRQEEVLAPARRLLENDLAERGLLHRRARVENVWGIIGCAIVAALALFLLSPGMASLSRIAVFTAGFAFVAIAGAITWITRRTWSTSRGEEALTAWHDEDIDPDERAIYDLIVNQDALVASRSGPDVAAPIRMVRQLRALGAG